MNKLYALAFLAVVQSINPNDLSIPQVSAGNDAIKKVVTIVSATGGAIAVLVIAVAGLRFVLSRGDPQSVNKVKNTIIYALIGLAVSLVAFSMVTFVLGRV